MKVKEMVKKLNQYDSDLEVIVTNANTGISYEPDVDLDEDEILITFDPDNELPGR